MMGVSPGSSLDDIISEAQKVEEILYRRNEEQRLAECFKQTSFRNNTLDTHKHYNDNHTNHYKSTQSSNLEHLSDNEIAFHQRNKYDTKSNGAMVTRCKIRTLIFNLLQVIIRRKNQILFNVALAELLDIFLFIFWWRLDAFALLASAFVLLFSSFVS